MPVEITGGWVRRRKGLGEELFWGWFAPGPFGSAQDRLKPRACGRAKNGSLRCVADAPNYGAEEKIGHSGRDDNGGEEMSEPFADQGEPFDSQGNLKPLPPEERRRADPPYAKGAKGRPPAGN
jgi:hypothetical protein